jgi:hypothetical protein
MTRVDLVSGALPATATDGVKPTPGALAPAAVGAVAAPAAPSAPAAVLGAAFERLRDVARAHPGASPETWIREAVTATLETRLPTVGGAVRGRLADQITQALLDDPGTRQRLARLLGDPA